MLRRVGQFGVLIPLSTTPAAQSCMETSELPSPFTTTLLRTQQRGVV
jgi:hypothetical protein